MNLRHNMDGISITHGNPGSHIWTYSAASSTDASACSSRTCSCSSTNNTAPLLFVGNNYYCDTAYDDSAGGNCFVTNTFFPINNNDPLWDGQQCDNEGTCCTNTDNTAPPWFRMDLRNPTSDDIEVCICGDEDTKFKNLMKILPFSYWRSVFSKV